MPGKIIFVMCENFAGEAQSALSAEGVENAVVATFPSRCGHPPMTSDELTALLAPLSDAEQVEVFGSCCLSGSADFAAHGPSLRMHRFGSCFELIADPVIISHYLAKGAYLTTPGWLADWPAAMKKLGFNQETAREMFAETTTGIVLLDTGVDERTAEHLQLFADFVDRPYEIFFAGLSVPRLLCARASLTWQLADQKMKSTAEISALQKQSATHAMAIDLLANLAHIVDEEQAIEAMLDVYSMLFAPQRVCYLSFQDGLPDNLWIKPSQASPHETETIKKNLAGLHHDSGYTESGSGFFVRIVQRGEVRGVIAVEEIAFPEHLNQYLNMALGIVNICELPIENARKYQKLIQTEEMLRKANDDLFLLSTTDSLTGISNRRAYDEYIRIEWKRMLRNRSPLSLIIGDIDSFKQYNDLYGHKQGDMCLHIVAQTIREMVVRPRDFVGRYGGEEFVIVLPDTPIEGAFHIAEKIRAAVAHHGIPHKRSVVAPYVTISLGVSSAVLPKAKDLSPALLFTMADAAMYEAKQQGRNCSVLHEIEAE